VRNFATIELPQPCFTDHITCIFSIGKESYPKREDIAIAPKLIMEQMIFAHPLVHLYQKSYILHADHHRSAANRSRSLDLLFTISLKNLLI